MDTPPPYPRQRTIDEFETEYAQLSGVTVEFLHYWGRYAMKCDCEQRACVGFVMCYQHEDAIFEEAQRENARRKGNR